MVRNLSRTVTVDDLMQLWQPWDSYDYLYVPCDAQHRGGGFAFINFLSHQLAVAFSNEWHGKDIAGYTTRSRLSVTVAQRQGMRANLAYWGLQELEDLALDRRLPVVFLRNERQDARRLYAAFRITPGEHAAAKASAAARRPTAPAAVAEPAARASNALWAEENERMDEEREEQERVGAEEEDPVSRDQRPPAGAAIEQDARASTDAGTQLRMEQDERAEEEGEHRRRQEAPSEHGVPLPRWSRGSTRPRSSNEGMGADGAHRYRL